MATTFISATARTELPVTNVSAWTNVVSLDTYATVPAGATHVLIETTYPANASSPAYGFQNGDDNTNYVYPTANRLVRFDWVTLNVAKTLSLYSTVANTIKYYVRAYTNHIVNVASTDMSSLVTNNSLTTLTCDSLPADAAGGAAIFIVDTDRALFCNVGGSAGQTMVYYVKKQMEIVPLNDLKQFDFQQSTVGGMTANQLVLVGYIPAGRFISNQSSKTELMKYATSWQNTAAADLVSPLDIYRYMGQSTANLYGFGTGGTTSSTTQLNPTSNPVYTIPNATTGKSAFYSSAVGASNYYYFVGGFAPSFTEVTLGSNNSIGRGAAKASLRVPSLNSLKSVKVGSLQANNFVGSNGLFSIALPNFVNGQTYPAYGTYPLVATDGTTTVNESVNLTPRYNEAAITITDVSANSLGYLQSYVPLAVGDVVTFKTPDFLNITANAIGADGLITTDFIGTQVIWVRTAATGIMTKVYITTSSANVTPNPLTFVPVGYAALNSAVTSNTVTVSGINTSATVSIVGGTYSKNGAAFVSTSGSVVNGDTLAVKVTAPSALGQSSIAYITVGSVTEDFLVSSAGAWAIPNAFSFTDQTNVARNTTVESNTITVQGVDSGVDVPISIAGGQFAINSGSGFGAFKSTPDVVRLGWTVKVNLATSASYGTAASTTLTIGGVDGIFTATTEAVDKIPDVATIAPKTQAVLSQSYTSTGITVSGMDAGIDVACTITGGTYEISTNGGSSWSAPASIAGTIRNGNMFRLTGTASNLNDTVRNVVFSVGEGTITNFTFVITTVAAPRTINLANKLVRNLVSPLYDTKITTSKTETVPNFIPGNTTTLLHSSVVNNTSVWLLNVPNFTTATIKLKQNITKAKGNIQVQINNTTGLSVGNNKLYLCKLNASNVILTFKRVNINIT